MAIALSGAILIAAWSQLNSYVVRAGPATDETVVVLPRGAGLAQITKALVDAGVIDHPWLFRLAVRVLGRDRDLKAGEYAFPAGATPQGVIAMLAKGETVARRLTVTEGLTVSEIFQLLQSTEGLVGDLPPPPRGRQPAARDVFLRLWRFAGRVGQADGRGHARDPRRSMVAAGRGLAVPHARGGPDPGFHRRQGDGGRRRARQGRGSVHQPPPPGHAPAGRPDGDLRAHRGGRRAGP